MDKFLITGGSGSFGTAFIERYHDQVDIAVYSRDEHKHHAMRERFPHVRYIVGDVRDAVQVEAAMESFGGRFAVLHAAALKHVSTGEAQPLEVVKTNVLGTSNVLHAASKHAAAFVLLSTDKAVQPTNLYGATKMTAERLVLSSPRRSFCVTRYGNVIESRGSVLHKFIAQVRAGEPMTVRCPAATRFVMMMSEAVDLVYGAATGEPPERLVIPTLPAVTIATLADAVQREVSNSSSWPWRVTGLEAGEKLHETLGDGITSDHAPRVDPAVLTATIRRAAGL